ncbi:MAG: glycosyltransferase [Chloroflexi bacterium]|nr:glycosyltransferase [Chloroflexota bacterium]
MRIFIGLTDIANITANYAKGFKALGHEVFSVVWSRSRFYPDSRYDLVIDDGIRKPGLGRVLSYLKMALRLLQLVKALRCDVFILYAPAVLPSHIYYPILKWLGKKIITAFWGSDVRYWYAFSEEMRSLGVESEVHPFFKYARERSGGSLMDKQRTIRVAETYSDLIISQPDCGQLQTRPYMRCSVPLDLSQYSFNVPGRERPLVLHAPSVPEAKGTDIILQVVNELKKEGISFDFQQIDNMPNGELRQLLSMADIVVDELYSATVGALSAEAMATGNTVLVRYMPDYCKVPDGCPAVNVNKFTLKEKLREIIIDMRERTRLAMQGRAYVEKVNDHVNICRDLLDWLARKDVLDYDFHPTFYREFHIPFEILEEEKKAHYSRRSDFIKMLLNHGSVVKRN